MTDLQHELLLELGREVCRCGRIKKRLQTFCGICYRSLPSLYRKQLYDGIGKGYEEAHAQAIKHLGASLAAKRASQ